MKFSFVYLSVLHERAYIIRSFIGCVTHSRSYARGVGSRSRLTLPLLRYTTSSSWGGSSGAFTRRLRMFDTMWNLIVVNKSSVDEDLASCLVCMYIYIEVFNSIIFDSGSWVNGVGYTGRSDWLESGVSKDEQQGLFIFLDKCGIGFAILVMRIIGGKICIEIWLLKYNWSNVFERVVWNEFACKHIIRLLFIIHIKITRFTIN